MAQLHGLETNSGNVVWFFSLCETKLKHAKNVIGTGELPVGMESH